MKLGACWWTLMGHATQDTVKTADGSFSLTLETAYQICRELGCQVTGSANAAAATGPCQARTKHTHHKQSLHDPVFHCDGAHMWPVIERFTIFTFALVREHATTETTIPATVQPGKDSCRGSPNSTTLMICWGFAGTRHCVNRHSTPSTPSHIPCACLRAANFERISLPTCCRYKVSYGCRRPSTRGAMAHRTKLFQQTQTQTHARWLLQALRTIHQSCVQSRSKGL